MCTSVRQHGTQCPQIFHYFSSGGKVWWIVDDIILISLDSLVHVHCQFVSTDVLIQAMLTSSAVVSSQLATSSRSPLSLPPQHPNTHLVTMWYGTAVYHKLSVTISDTAVHFCPIATLILIIRYLLYLLNTFLEQLHETHDNWHHYRVLKTVCRITPTDRHMQQRVTPP